CASDPPHYYTGGRPAEYFEFW
nr:immunoglobulin heavy chain junction region [Macaca mulatta]